jgi:pimeloyl-ACP methyl ester carboxylesterase
VIVSGEAYELHLLLKKAGIKPPYVLVGHSVGGLIARVYTEHYNAEVAGMVLVDSTHEDTTLFRNGKLVPIRSLAQKRPVPAVQTMQSSPPRPPTDEDKKQAAEMVRMFGPPKIEPPFDKLPSDVQKVRLWMLLHPKLSATPEDFFPEELEAIRNERLRIPCPLRNRPLISLVAVRSEAAPPGISQEEWKRLEEGKQRQKADFATLSSNSQVIYAHNSGRHIQLDEPGLVIDAIRKVVEAVRRRVKLASGS